MDVADDVNLNADTNTDITESEGVIEIAPDQTDVNEKEELTSYQQEQLTPHESQETHQDDETPMVGMDCYEEQELVVEKVDNVIKNEPPSKKEKKTGHGKKNKEPSSKKKKNHEKKMKEEENDLKERAKAMAKMARRIERKKKKELKALEKKKKKEQNQSETEKRIDQTFALLKIFHCGQLPETQLWIEAKKEVEAENNQLHGIINEFIKGGQPAAIARESALSQLEETRNIKWSVLINEEDGSIIDSEDEEGQDETLSDVEFVAKVEEEGDDVEDEYQEYDDDDDEEGQGKLH